MVHPSQRGRGGAANTGKAASIEGDRLAKIGLFVGGAGGPALDYARRTAIGVEKLGGIIKAAAGQGGRSSEFVYA